MATEILLPAASAGVEHATLLRWLKQEGDWVKKGEALAEVETDKAVMEVAAEAEGRLGRIVVAGGTEAVAVGAVIGLLIADGEPLSERAAVPRSPVDGDVSGELDVAAPAAAKAAVQASAPASRRIMASVLARRMAADQAIDLAGIKGSGPEGRIVRIDVERAARSVAAHAEPQAAAPGGGGAFDLIPHSGMRKTIARRLSEAKQQIPHFYLSIDCRVDELLSVRERLNARTALAHSPFKLSVNDFVVATAARVLRLVPEVNCAWTDQGIQRFKDVDLSVAVSTDNGLITPIVRSADRKGLAELSSAIRALADKARAGRLAPSEYQGGSFTISNLGMFGVREFAAIINPPQAAILAVGAIEKRAVVDADRVIPGQVMTLTLSADHRVIDGAVAARFLAQLRELIEDPINLLV